MQGIFVPIEVTSYIEIKQGAVKFGRKSRGFPWTLTIRPKFSENPSWKNEKKVRKFATSFPRPLPWLQAPEQSRTQGPRAFWSADKRPERLWDNGLEHFLVGRLHNNGGSTGSP